MHVIISIYRYMFVLQFIDASDLEKATKKEDPGRYHKAVTALADCDGILVPGKTFPCLTITILQYTCISCHAFSQVVSEFEV